MDDRTPGEKLFAVKTLINKMKRDLEHQDHIDRQENQLILTARGARAILRAALAEIERQL